MQLDPTEISCGVYQLSDLRSSNIEDSLAGEIEGLMYDNGLLGIDGLAVSDFREYFSPAFIVFSDVASTIEHKSNAAKLIAFINKNKLGNVTVSNSVTNPRTGNKIKVFVWQLNRKNLYKWLKIALRISDGKDLSDDAY